MVRSAWTGDGGGGGVSAAQTTMAQPASTVSVDDGTLNRALVHMTSSLRDIACHVGSMMSGVVNVMTGIVEVVRASPTTLQRAPIAATATSTGCDWSTTEYQLQQPPPLASPASDVTVGDVIADALTTVNTDNATYLSL